MRFEWDADKAALNLKKHGVDFRDAVRVFYDVNRIEWYDSAHSDDEDRYNTIGMVREVLFVVYTERRERTRILFARKATLREGESAMIVTYHLKPNTPLTPEQIKRLDALKDRPIVFDEDCPEMTEELLRQFKPVHPRGEISKNLTLPHTLLRKTL